jgi:hypothetical protein
MLKLLTEQEVSHHEEKSQSLALYIHSLIGSNRPRRDKISEASTGV